MSQRKALLFLVLAALGWSLGGVLIKGIDWHPMAISGARSLIGAVVILACFRDLRITGSRYQVGGALAYAGTVILFVLATKMTTAANAILLQYTAPVYVALFSPWFLGEPARRSDWAAIGVVLGGMVLFFLDRLSPAGLWGNIAALASGFCFGWLALFLRRQKGASTIESLLLGNLVAAAAGLPFFFGAPPSARSVAALLLLGVVQLGVPYILYALAIRHVTAVTAILVPMIEPVLNPVWVLLATGEVPGALSIAGGVIILGAVGARSIHQTARGRA
jgi:drug/metabolite transporter (DMT)-like permease